MLKRPTEGPLAGDTSTAPAAILDKQALFAHLISDKHLTEQRQHDERKPESGGSSELL